MTDIIITWLNTEVDLSQKINEEVFDIEKKFSNGYLLGELLHKFNQITEFESKFRNKEDRDSKLLNFKALEKVFRNMEIKFTSKHAEEIMNKRPGTVSQLLYQIRMKLEKKGTTIEATRNFKQGSQVSQYSEMKIGRKMEQYDELNAKLFSQSLGKKMIPQKEIDMREHLHKFELWKKKEDENIRDKTKEEERKLNNDKRQRMDLEKGKAQRLHSFNQQFEQKGIENWKDNIIAKKTLEKKELDFQLKEAQKYQRIVLNSIKNSELNTQKQIEDFENNLKQTGSSAGNSLNETKIKKNDKVVESCELMIAKIREKTLQNPDTKRERDRRRRKIIVEQSKAQTEIENRRREEQLIKKLDKKSNQEKQLAYEFWRVDQNKKIIIENRKLREEMYEERKEMDKKFNQNNEEEFIRHHQYNFARDIQKEELRSKQLEISKKQKNRTKNSDLCRDMINLIIEIADEAYVYQQTNDTEIVDDRVWREWMQLYINNQSSAKHEDLNEFGHIPDNQLDNQLKNYNNSTMSLKSAGNNNNFNNDSANTELGLATAGFISEKTLDDCEFLDYLSYIGQWRKGLIPNNAFVTINLNELMASESQANIVDKNKKVQPGKPETNKEEYKEDDVENLIIPKEPSKNCYLGNLVDALIDIAYEESEIQEKKHLFNHVPIKLSLIGHAFAGKKTQATILSENFPFKIYKIDELITNILDKMDKLENVERQTENTCSSNFSHMSMIRNRNQNSTLSPELKRISTNIKELLKNGEAITDEIYVDLLLEHIKNDFPEKTMEEISKDTLQKIKRKMEILEEIKDIKEDKENDPNSRLTEEAVLNEELMKIGLDSTKGFVIVDFPNTYNQAKLLEQKLSGYIPEIEKPLNEAQILKQNASLILDKTAKNLPPRQLIPGGLDFVFLLDVPPTECIRRALGLRIDPVTKIVYHIEDNLPQTTDNYVCERLKLLDDNTNSLSSLVTRHLAFERICNLVVEFYEPFGIEKSQLRLFNEIKGSKNKDLITHDLIDVLNKLIEINETKENELYQLEELRVKQEELNEKEYMKDHPEHDSISGPLSERDNKSQISKSNFNNNNIITNQPINNDANPNSDYENTNKPVEVLDSNSTDELTKYNLRVAEVKSKLSKELLDILVKLWFQIYNNYLKECKLIFRFLRKQRDFISESFNALQQKFIEFLKRPSKKQILLLDYQYTYNKFLDDFPDLIDDPAVKCEHHQNVDDLSDKIWEIIEQRKNEAIDERKRIMTSNWIENEMEKLYIHLERLFQAEIDKFTGSLQTIRDFYFGLDNRALLELPLFTIDIIKEEPDSTPLEHETDPTTFPRLEKLYKTSLKVQFQYDESIYKAEKEKISSQLEKEQKDKKAKVEPKKKNVAPTEVLLEEKKEVYIYEEEMKQAVKLEKTKFRYRITLLKYWGMHCFTNMRKLANNIYNKLDDWIILSIKAENEALNQLTDIIREGIEKEEKIKYELELDTFDTIINLDMQNYNELPPKPLPEKEIIDHNKFNIKQLKLILDELKTYEIQKNVIRTSTFIDILIKKYISSSTDSDVYYGLPNCLKKLSFHNFYKFIRYFDLNNSDILNFKYVATVLCLINSKPCNDINEQTIRSSLKNTIKITREQFINFPMWFDNDEACISLPGYEVYDRVAKLKNILFDINKDDDDTINVNDFLKIVTLKIIHYDNTERDNKTMYDILFF